eukprot:24709-Eustigmatos_ZCMA.PRE.1
MHPLLTHDPQVFVRLWAGKTVVVPTSTQSLIESIAGDVARREGWPVSQAACCMVLAVTSVPND